MNKPVIILFFFLLLFMSCNNKESARDVEETTLVFEVVEPIKVQNSTLMSPEKVVSLAFSDSTLIDRNAQLLKDSTYFVYSVASAVPIMRFDSDGDFLNYVGRVGAAPTDYIKITDVCLNRKKQYVEVLSGNSIKVYDYAGQYQNELKHSCTAFAFAVDNKENHWFYLGNNAVDGHAKLVKMDASCEERKEFLHEKSRLLPMVENNFGKGEVLTFRESLNHSLYIADDTLKRSCHIDFGDYRLPHKLHEVAPMEAVELLRNSNYARIMHYSENNDYLCLQVMLNESARSMPRMFYWIIQKHSNKKQLIQLDETISTDSYLYYPQFLSADNRLYFLGYVLDAVTGAGNPEENPSVVIVNVEALFE